MVRHTKYRRPSKALVVFALLAPVLLGMLGLVLDGGLMASAHRQTQNAADAAALAAAMDLFRGRGVASATASATTYVQNYNGLASASVTLNSPPSTGPYAGNNQFVEVVVSYTVNTLLIQILRMNNTQSVSARAVAGWEPVTAGEGVGVLDPNPSGNTGLSVSGNGTTLKVKGRIVVNATDANAAATASNGTVVKAVKIEVVGGVNNPANFQPYNTGDPSPLTTGALPEPDPLINLGTPMVGASGFFNRDLGSPSVTNGGASGLVLPNTSGGGVTTLNPGIYHSIDIKGGTVNLNPGIYVLQQPSGGGGANILSITGGTVTGTGGVMFYNTGSDYNPNTGSPDLNDGTATPSPPGGTKFGGININGATASINLSPLTTGDFAGMLFYQRRWNTQTVKITSSGSLQFGGTLYNKWGKFDVTGGGTYDAQFIAGSMSLSGGASLTILNSGGKLAKANQVFLVE